MRQSLFYFSGAEKLCLAHWLKQLTRDVKSDVRTLNFISDVNFKPQQKTSNVLLIMSFCDVNDKNERNDD